MNKLKRLICCIIVSFLLGNVLFFSSTNSKADNKSEYNIFVGDSRTVGMEKALTDEEKENSFFVSKKGKGLVWLIDEGMDEIKEIIEEGKTYNIFFMLGVNDLNNQSRYVKYFNQKGLKELEGQNLYFVSVGPVMEDVLIEHGFKQRKNNDIEKFNSYLRENLNKKYTYIDVYEELVNVEGFGTIDGLHYISYTYTRIYSLIVDILE